MRKLLAVVVVVLLLGAGVWWWIGGSAGLVDAALPEFPDFPEPVADLSSGGDGEIYFASATPFDLEVLLGGGASLPTTGVGTLLLPEADAPVPGMVVLHGSGGITPGREMEYGRLLSENGYAAFVLDYYAPRGVTRETNYMLRVLSVTEFDAVADAYAALRVLGTHPAVDANRIGVMGFSYGGMAARFAMDERVRRALAPDLPGFAVFVDYYGPCFQNLRSTETNGAALLTLRGSEDASNDLEACARREEELRALGSPVDAIVYEGAGHAWEADTPRKLFEQSPYVAGCEIRYDQAGRSHLGDALLIDVPRDASREDRIAARMATGSAMGDCVQSGYVIGRDDDTREKSDAALLSFLFATLQR